MKQVKREKQDEASQSCSGFHQGASAEEVRAAYLKAAIQTHPDSASTSQAGPGINVYGSANPARS